MLLSATAGESSSSLPTFVYAIVGVFFGLIVLWTVLNYLWNKKLRPRRIKQGIPTATFNNILGRLLRFVFKEDKYPSAKFKKKNPKLAKFVTWRNSYAVLFIFSMLQYGFSFGSPNITLGVLLVMIAVRSRKIFYSRYKVIKRMFDVAHSEFKYPRGADLNPWAYIQVRQWESLTVPGQTVVVFPAAFKSEDARNRENFERHFDGTVTDDNSWIYKWKSSESYVQCDPVSHIPELAPYPGSANRPWNEIPLGVGSDGEIVASLNVTPHFLITGTTGAGKSVLQRNLIFHCIQHKDMFRFLGVDLKRVELRPFAKYSDVVMGIATTLEDALEICRYANDEMMRRYEEMEEIGVNHFLDLPNPPFALMLMIDEATQLLAPEGVKTDEGKVRDELHGEALTILGAIARLGRAAGVHMVMATQRPDAKILSGELKQNLAGRIAAGRMDSIASNMTLDNDNGTRLPGNIKGRGYFQINGVGQQFQGYFAKQDWIDIWLDSQEGSEKTSNDADGDLRQDVAAASAPVVPEEKRKGLLARIKAYNAEKAKEVQDFDEAIVAQEEKESQEEQVEAKQETQVEEKKSQTIQMREQARNAAKALRESNSSEVKSAPSAAVIPTQVDDELEDIFSFDVTPGESIPTPVGKSTMATSVTPVAPVAKKVVQPANEVPSAETTPVKKPTIPTAPARPTLPTRPSIPARPTPPARKN